MPTPPLEDQVLEQAVQALKDHGNQVAAAAALGIARNTLQNRLRRAAERGFMGPLEPLPGFSIKQISQQASDGSHVKMVREPGEVFELPEGFDWKRISAFVDEEGRWKGGWKIAEPDAQHKLALMRAVVDGLKDEITPVPPVALPATTREDLLSQYTITDAHIGCLAWNEETGGGDWDLTIAEQTLVDWFAAAIAASPPSEVAVLAQLGDILHHDGFKSVTPEHGHVLDADSRFPKMVRAVIRALRRIVGMLLEKHGRVHIVMADDNHSPAAEVWLRELFAVLYENEPRVTVDTSPGTYCFYEFGDVVLFYHHGHKRGLKDVDSVFAGRFREVYGRAKHAYAHIGHRHSDEMRTTNLMKVEQHETLAAPDAYAANGGWLSGRSAKVIHYHKRNGEVGRNTITAAMVMQ